MLSGLLRRCGGRPGGRDWSRCWRRGLVAGQPIHDTHPEVLAVGELAPGLGAWEFAQRRRRLAAKMPPRSVAVLSSTGESAMVGLKSPSRQDSNFLYLTGVTQRAVAVIKQLGSASKDPGDHFFALFVPAPSERDCWDGKRMDHRAAVECFGAHEAFPMAMLSHKLPQLVRDASAVLFDLDREPESRDLVAEVKAMLVARALGQVEPLGPYVHALRWRKSPAEIQLLGRSASLAASALRRCMEISRPGVAEATLAATFEYLCKVGGAQNLAYPAIAASGPDCCAIHYSRNDKTVRERDLILMDAGCELFGYASGVTRTWPATGRFSGPQRDLYEVVRAVHRCCLLACQPGMSLMQMHHMSVQTLCEGLHSLGIGSASVSTLMKGAYKKFYPHMIGHYLGIDVHDTTHVPWESPLEPGVVLGLQPGLYIPDEDGFGAFRGLGVRIEDGVVVTEQGPRVLSGGAPIEAEHIEAVVGWDVACDGDEDDFEELAICGS
ncbi:unnamed protein product [Ostreobium quekettii]|uniref:Aminopeptidase P N-terminal domain-containing protein n=1 Tax=Ostreobium quekettii TaxID=121088 RepID=A0A8S1IL57_9CHLO|nr:unnamed protein product [Ostreobium quekettii]|eukprot:evm.model.scf_601.4 EVM.evm.TU.scf_601.4   scf_601:31981-37540(+)